MVEIGVVALVFCGMLLEAETSGDAQTAVVEISFGERLGQINMGQMGLGQGGLSEEPMWENRVPEIRALRPEVIRLFVQEYFNLLPEHGRYHFATLDRSVDTICRTGAQPLLSLCFKPRVLFPEINQDITEPNDWDEWEALIFNLVKHYRDRGTRIGFWEVGNEPDIGEDGGCPYRFHPESYVRYYQHTVDAILRADPEARVGGPATASIHSPIIPALLEHSAQQKTPLHFLSWHIYSSDPQRIRKTIEHAKQLREKYALKDVALVLDEWNMDLMNPPSDPRFQPCFVVETVFQMLEAGLDYSCYYQIRDYHIEQETFAAFMSPEGAAFMARWWNRAPQYDGLFDYQNTVRPVYFAWKLLSRMSGERLPVSFSHPGVHGLAVLDTKLRMHSVLIWNFSPKSVSVTVRLKGLPQDVRLRHTELDAADGSNEETSRLRIGPANRLSQGDQQWTIPFEPYSIHYWSLE